MSGAGWKNSKGMNTEGEMVKGWFDKNNIEIIDHLEGNKSTYKKYSSTNVMSKLKKNTKRVLSKVKNKLN